MCDNLRFKKSNNLIRFTTRRSVVSTHLVKQPIVVMVNLCCWDEGGLTGPIMSKPHCQNGASTLTCYRGKIGFFSLPVVFLQVSHFLTRAWMSLEWANNNLPLEPFLQQYHHQNIHQQGQSGVREVFLKHLLALNNRVTPHHNFFSSENNIINKLVRC